MNMWGDCDQGGSQYLEQPNVERPIFRKFEILNIKRTKVFRFFYFRSHFFILDLVKLFEHTIYDSLYGSKFMDFLL